MARSCVAFTTKSPFGSNQRRFRGCVRGGGAASFRPSPATNAFAFAKGHETSGQPKSGVGLPSPEAAVRNRPHIWVGCRRPGPRSKIVLGRERFSTSTTKKPRKITGYGPTRALPDAETDGFVRRASRRPPSESPSLRPGGHRHQRKNLVQPCPPLFCRPLTGLLAASLLFPFFETAPERWP